MTTSSAKILFDSTLNPVPLKWELFKVTTIESANLFSAIKFSTIELAEPNWHHSVSLPPLPWAK